jgi:hypothetical protein
MTHWKWRAAPAIVALALPLAVARADWQRTGTTLAWAEGGNVVWQFSFDPAKGKAFFHPVSAGGGPSLTNYRPADHPWHYALWFSWKYINGVNYWEEDRRSGKAAGRTSWTPPEIETRPDGRATLRLKVSYTHPSGRVDMSETRTLAISAPDRTGGYAIDWSADFTAGPEGAELGRTPMPGEPGGQINGGYAGLSLRLAPVPLTLAMITVDGPVAGFVRGRARPDSPAVACNLSADGRAAGAIAILSAPGNIAEQAPWYLIQSEEMRFACAAILAPQVRKLPPEGAWKLRYRIAVREAAWTPDALRAAWRGWAK